MSSRERAYNNPVLAVQASSASTHPIPQERILISCCAEEATFSQETENHNNVHGALIFRVAA